MPDAFRKDELKSWLYSQDRDVSQFLSLRAALRVFPLLAAEEFPHKQEMIQEVTFLSCRALLSAQAALYRPTLASYSSIKNLSKTDLSFATGVAGNVAKLMLVPIATAYAATYVAYAVRTIDGAAKLAEAAGILDPFCDALYADRSAIETAWEPGQVPDLPVWADGQPQVIKTKIDELVTFLKADECDWQFWLGWLDNLSLGQAPDTERLFTLAGWDDADWQKGRGIMNPLLAGVVEMDSIYAELNSPADADILRVTLERVTDVLADAIDVGGIGEQQLETVILRRLVERYARDAQRVEMDLMLVHRSLRRQIDAKELVNTPALMALVDVCEIGALDLRATNPELAKSRETRQSQFQQEKPALRLGRPRKIADLKIVAARDFDKVPAPSGVALPSLVARKSDEPDGTGSGLHTLFEKLSKSLPGRYPGEVTRKQHS